MEVLLAVKMQSAPDYVPPVTTAIKVQFHRKKILALRVDIAVLLELQVKIVMGYVPKDIIAPMLVQVALQMNAGMKQCIVQLDQVNLLPYQRDITQLVAHHHFARIKRNASLVSIAKME